METKKCKKIKEKNEKNKIKCCEQETGNGMRHSGRKGERERDRQHCACFC